MLGPVRVDRLVAHDLLRDADGILRVGLAAYGHDVLDPARAMARVAHVVALDADGMPRLLLAADLAGDVLRLLEVGKRLPAYQADSLSC